MMAAERVAVVLVVAMRVGGAVAMREVGRVASTAEAMVVGAMVAAMAVVMVASAVEAMVANVGAVTGDARVAHREVQMVDP